MRQQKYKLMPKSKVIPISSLQKKPIAQEIPSAAAAEEAGNDYVSKLRQMSQDLRQLAEIFEVSCQEAVTDFLYIAVGDEIVNTMLEGGDDEEDS